MEMLKTLNQAKKLIFDEPEKAVQPASEQGAPGQPEPPPQDPEHVAGKQDA